MAGGGKTFLESQTPSFLPATSRISANSSNHNGGGIYNSAGGKVTIVQSRVFSNGSARDGAGIYSTSTVPNALVIRKSTLDNNHTVALGDGVGGSLFVGNFAQVILEEVTISNSSAKHGGGIYESRFAFIKKINLTEAGNTARGRPAGGGKGMEPGFGGGTYVEPDAQVEIVNSIVAGNTADFGPDVFGMVVSLGYNLIGNGSDSSGWHPELEDQVGTSLDPIDPLLSELGFWGGPTPTHLLLPGSTARDRGSNAHAPSPTDQRGYARFVDVRVDIGAVEMQPGEIDALFSRLTPIPKSRRRR